MAETTPKTIVTIDKDKLVSLADNLREATNSSETFSADTLITSLSSYLNNHKITMGTFSASATGSRQTIQHNLGITPKIIFLFCMSSYTSASTSSGRQPQIQFSYLKINDDLTYDYTYNYNYPNYKKYYASKSSSNQSTLYYDYVYEGSVYASTTLGNTSYCINNVNSSSFTSPSYIYKGKEYFWIAIAN